MNLTHYINSSREALEEYHAELMTCKSRYLEVQTSIDRDFFGDAEPAVNSEETVKAKMDIKARNLI
jgi:hypothetical protein